MIDQIFPKIYICPIAPGKNKDFFLALHDKCIWEYLYEI